MGQDKKAKVGASSVEPGRTFGETLHGVLVRTIEEDRSPGLLTLQFPTGVGKSYAVERAIATLVSRAPEPLPPILFVTPQKKNIPSVDAIAGLCRREGYEPLPHDVMRLRSVPEMLSETVRDGMLENIPYEHRAKTNVEEVIDTVRCLRGSRGYGDAIRRILPEFRRSVRSLFPCAGLDDRIDLLEHDGDWRWLAELWPAVFTRRAKVLLMTSSKLFLPHDTLVEAPCPIDEADWLRGSVVFMDEFDSTKKDCLNAIVSKSTRGRADLPGLVRSLWHGVDVSTLPESMLAADDAGRNAKRIGQLRHVLDETAHKTSVDYVYKADEEAVGAAELFMYDGTRRGTSIGTTFYVRTDEARRENVIVKKQVAGDGSRRLASDVSELRGAVTYSQSVIASMLRERHGYGLVGMDEKAVKNEILSTLEALGVKDRGGQMLMLDGIREILKGGNAFIYYYAAKTHVSVADFMAFSAAYGQVSFALMEFASIAGQTAEVKPMLDLVLPILETAPEADEGKPSVESLDGSIRVSDVTFSYGEGGPTILRDLSFTVRPGEYVALVGKSGCGKSTILRLLLGFETPDSGSIYYGPHDVQRVDLRSLRQHIGTVLQDGKLFMGDMASNITLSTPGATIDDAWTAAEVAGIADDIRKMPQGMQTLVSEGSGGVSGGQRQRLLIARAVCGNRRILLFDEATSALDNKTQKHVSESLDALACTRLVIAHRLSTVRNCDRILVVDGGRIAEEGSYDELVAKGGLFHELVKRQMLDSGDSAE